MEKNKLIVYIVIILFVIFFLLIIIFNALSKIKKTEEKKSATNPLKNNSSVDLRFSEKNKQPIKTSLKDEKQVILPPVFVGEDGYGQEKESIFQAKKDELLKKLPLSSSDFLIIYNQQAGKFEAYLKDTTKNSRTSLFNWLKLNGFSEEEINGFFEIKNQTINDYLTQPQNTSSINFSTESSNLNGSSNLNTSINLLTDFLKIFLSLSNINYNQIESITPPETNPSMPTSSTSITPTSNYGIPQGYNPNARGCYTPKRFIEVYADGLTPDGPPNCYQNVKARVESYLIPIDFLGGRIKVHQKTVPYFQAVNQELAPYQINGRTYKFKQGTYTFSYLGTYAFRCNVNASTTKDVWNVCDPGCILSPHSFGFAIDINPQTNQNHSDQFDMPPEVVAAFRRYGFRWGGEWKDAMHFEYLGEICRN